MTTYLSEIKNNINVIDSLLVKLKFTEGLSAKDTQVTLVNIENCINLIINIYITFLDGSANEEKSKIIIFDLCKKFMEYSCMHYVAKLIFLYNDERYDTLNKFILKNL